MPREQTQLGMNEAADKEFRAADAEMTQVFNSLLKRAADKPEAIAKLKESQAAWKAYRDAQVKAMWPFPERGMYGSAYPMCVATEMTTLTKARVAELRTMLAPLEGDVCSSQWPE